MRLKQLARAEVWSWLFYQDDMQETLRYEGDNWYSLSYGPKSKGPLDQALQPFNIVHVMDWDCAEYVLGSCKGFRAGDARFFFPGEQVELVGRRFAADVSTDGRPTYWESQIFDNNAVVLSRQQFSELGEATRITEVYRVDNDDELIAKSFFHETKACYFCISRNTVCECPKTLKRRVMSDQLGAWNAVRRDYSGSAWNKFRRFLQVVNGGPIVSLWCFEIQFNIGGTFQSFESTWNVTFQYETEGCNLDDLRTSFIQGRLTAMQSWKNRRCGSESRIDTDSSSQHAANNSPSLVTKENGTKGSTAAITSGQNVGKKGPKSPSQCPYCSATFGRVYEMKRHCSNVHMRVRDFVCEQCGKAFSQKVHLTKHIFAVHDDIRNFDCPSCELKFRSKCKLQRHYNAVHLCLRPIMCKLCGKSFQQNSDARRHIMAKHSSEVQALSAEEARGKLEAMIA